MTPHVLIIDDDPAIREMLALYLRGRGYSTRTAPDGATGLEQCRSGKTDLVMCDLRMPGMDGLEVLASLSANHPELPVVVVSGTADLGDAIDALRLGAWDYVTKPIMDLAALDHAIQRSLERARLLAENRAYRERLEDANRKLEDSLRQIQDDEEAGRKIQFMLLPEPSLRFGSIECSRFLRTSSFLSGDFADYFAIDDARFAFYFADVSGHGVPSAVVTVMLKCHISRYLENHRRYQDPTICNPAELLRELNGNVLADRHGKFVTMFYAVVDPGSASLSYANAGQYPYPWHYDGYSSTQIGGRSAPIGLFEGSTYHEERIAIGERFALTLFSDGVLELLDDGGLDERNRRLGEASRNDRHDAGSLAQSLGVAELGTAPDDASILIVRRIAADA